MTEDPEILFKAVADCDWPAALSSVHRLKAAEDPVSASAREVLTEAVMQQIASASPTMGDADLEKVIMLHKAQCLGLADAQLDAIAEELVIRNRDRPEQAVRFARHRPRAPACRAVLDQFDAPNRVRGSVTDHGRPTHVGGPAIVDGRRSVFRSNQEQAFFQAAVRAFPGKLLVPNAALHSAVEIDAISSYLNEPDRRLFFRVLIDLIVFDPLDQFKPSHFFELDSPWHDDPFRDDRDKKKERFITLAGGALIRIRTTGPLGPSGMQALLATALTGQPSAS